MLRQLPQPAKNVQGDPKENEQEGDCCNKRHWATRVAETSASWHMGSIRSDWL